MNQSKAKKKSTKGAKNWRKNIDVSAAETTRIKKLQEKVDQDEINNIKESDLFEYDNNKEELPKGFLKRKIKNDELEKQRLKALEKKGYNRMIQRKADKIEKGIIDIPNTCKTNDRVDQGKEMKEVLDLWGEDIKTNTKKNRLNNKSIISLPRITLPHPGLSYNPTLEDSKNLITTVANLNKEVLIKPSILNEKIEEENRNLPLREKFIEQESDSESEVEDGIQEITSNTQDRRLTKTQRNKKHKARLNKLKNEKEHIKKMTKIEIVQIKAAKNFEKIQNKNMEEAEKQLKKEKERKKKEEELIRLGAYIE